VQLVEPVAPPERPRPVQRDAPTGILVRVRGRPDTGGSIATPRHARQTVLPDGLALVSRKLIDL